MGRELRRVPLDFDHPVGEVWPGFLNPHYKHCHDCADCEGSGYSPEARRFKAEWYGSLYDTGFDPASTGSAPFPPEHPKIVAMARRNTGLPRGGQAMGLPETSALRREAVRLAEHFNASWSHHLAQADVDALVAAGRLTDFTHRPRTEAQAAALAATGRYWMEESNGYAPTAAEVNEWSIGGMGHDGINSGVCIDARCKREGVPVECATCGGKGSRWDSEEAEATAEAWEREEPPPGDAYQIWETVSEGSPVSPAFATAEELAEWMVANDDSITRDTTREQWLAFINGPGWAPSLIGEAGKGLRSGVAALSGRMTPADLTARGHELYGRCWQTDLAEALGVDSRTVRRWIDGSRGIPDDLEDRLAELAAAKRRALAKIEKKSRRRA